MIRRLAYLFGFICMSLIRPSLDSSIFAESFGSNSEPNACRAKIKEHAESQIGKGQTQAEEIKGLEAAIKNLKPHQNNPKQGLRSMVLPARSECGSPNFSKICKLSECQKIFDEHLALIETHSPTEAQQIFNMLLHQMENRLAGLKGQPQPHPNPLHEMLGKATDDATSSPDLPDSSKQFVKRQSDLLDKYNRGLMSLEEFQKEMNRLMTDITKGNSFGD